MLKHKQFSNLSDLKLQPIEIYRHLGYGQTIPDETVKQLVENIITNVGLFCYPKAEYVIYPGDTIDSKSIRIGETVFKVGTVIRRYLENTTHFAVFVVTAGAEFNAYLQQLREEGDIVSEFIANAVGSEIVERAALKLCDLVQNEGIKNGFSVTKSYSPGHCSWSISEQKQLFTLLPENSCGVTLNESCLMHPVKSISGIIGMGSNVMESPDNCEICTMQKCYKRKVAIKH